MAGPFEASDFGKFVPADKKLLPDWTRALFERGVPAIYRGKDLQWIGMPAGGLCTGQMYLGGDGKLWLWHIFRAAHGGTGAEHYTDPLEPKSPLEQGFAIRVSGTGIAAQTRELDRRGFDDVAFQGQYPMALVTYRDKAACPVEVELEAYSPFIPLDAENSSLPATVMRYTVKNTGTTDVDVDLAGWLQNAVCPEADQPTEGRRKNRVLRKPSRHTLLCTAEPNPVEKAASPREDVLFADFEGETYEGWTAEGTAFGKGPFARRDMPDYHDVEGHHGDALVNTHNTRNGEDITAADAHTGTLTSDEFTISRRFIHFRIGGGNHPGKTCVNLLVDGKVVRTATGRNSNSLRSATFDASEWEGKKARLQIVDMAKGGWGNVGVDYIVFSDSPSQGGELEKLPGYGSMALSLLGDASGVLSCPSVPGNEVSATTVFDALGASNSTEPAVTPFGQPLVGALGRRFTLKPGASESVTFLVSWWFPFLGPIGGGMEIVTDIERLNRHYINRFSSASSVADYVARNYDWLSGQTRLWRDTWYDSTLPHWFLDRTFLTVDALATQTCFWFDNGRFWGWEGVECCPGTCQHVWNYAQGAARVFPELERSTREMVDYGIAYREDGALDYRAEAGRHVAHDGQCGTIIRTYREHQMSPDSAFLKRIWPRVKKSIEYMIAQDGDDNGILEGVQYNTLDAAWYGPMGWISSMYLAALAAGRQMALEMGDDEFAKRCAGILEAGRTNIVKDLYNGEYFIHKPDPKHPRANNTNDGCHIDQVFGQSLAWQIGLDRVVPRTETVSALEALWKYNFTPDVGPFREGMKDVIPGGRWYAMPGEAGLLMCTWPRGGAEKCVGKEAGHFAGYFNECMHGFEYQVASHMVWESEPDGGLVEKGLAITRSIEDRYHPSKRNPYNEVECGDHYARSMASYGVFLAACGYEYHGPKGYLAFSPRLTPRDFRAPFTTAEGWGTFHQKREGKTQADTIEVKWGQLRLRTLAFGVADGAKVSRVEVTANGQAAPCAWEKADGKVRITLGEEVVLDPHQALEVRIA
jgi:non-lysosomal glucosylceramidase